MILGTRNDLSRGDFVHWVWVWMLTVLVLSAVWSTAIGQEIRPGRQADESNASPRLQKSWPMPMPNVDQPNDFRYPNGDPDTTADTLGDVIRLNRRCEYESVLGVWKKISVSDATIPWRHVGIGVAQLRLDRLDQATERLQLAIQIDPDNAVAEYFLGKVYRARGREVPFWFEPDESSPYHLIALRGKSNRNRSYFGREPAGTMLPHFKGVPFDMEAKRHFGRAIRLAPRCDLNQVLKAVYPQLQLVGHSTGEAPITVRDLLKSLGEEDYLEKARLEVGEPYFGADQAK